MCGVLGWIDPRLMEREAAIRWPNQLDRFFAVAVLLWSTLDMARLTVSRNFGQALRDPKVTSPLRRSSGTDLGQAILSLAETRAGEEPPTVILTLMGPGFGSHGGPLKGNVTADTKAAFL